MLLQFNTGERLPRNGSQLSFFFLLETKLKRGEGKKIDAEMGF